MPKRRSTIQNNKKRYQNVPKKDITMKRWLDSTRQFNKDFAGDLPTYEQYRNMPRKAKKLVNHAREVFELTKDDKDMYEMTGLTQIQSDLHYAQRFNQVSQNKQRFRPTKNSDEVRKWLNTQGRNKSYSRLLPTWGQYKNMTAREKRKVQSLMKMQKTAKTYTSQGEFIYKLSEFATAPNVTYIKDDPRIDDERKAQAQQITQELNMVTKLANQMLPPNKFSQYEKGMSKKQMNELANYRRGRALGSAGQNMIYDITAMAHEDFIAKLQDLAAYEKDDGGSGGVVVYYKGTVPKTPGARGKFAMFIPGWTMQDFHRFMTRQQNYGYKATVKDLREFYKNYDKMNL